MERKLYKLICTIDGILKKEIISGSLREIDNYIIDHNINSPSDLGLCLTDEEVEEANSCEFSITYKHDGQIKNKPILYKDEILKFRNGRIKYIVEQYISNKTFRYFFLEKYVLPYRNVKPDIKIKSLAIKILSNPDNVNPDILKEFLDLYTEKKQKYTKEELETFDPSERIEIEQMGGYKYITDYGRLRGVSAGTFNRNSNSVKMEIKKEPSLAGNEFEELMIHDQNPDTGIVYPEDCSGDDYLGPHKLRK